MRGFLKDLFSSKAARAWAARKPAENAVTLGSLAERLKQIYELPEGNLFQPIRHDGIHAMTGFDIGIADELRVAICETALNYPRNKAPLGRAFKREEALYGMLKSAVTSRYNLNAAESGLARKSFRRIQSRTERLEKAEIEDLYLLGKQMNEAIRRLTGKYYRKLSVQDIVRIEFKDVDFVAEAQAIKQKYEKPKNKRVRDAMARHYYKAAARLGREADIPAQGSPWHGPQKRAYAPVMAAQAPDGFRAPVSAAA